MRSFKHLPKQQQYPPSVDTHVNVKQLPNGFISTGGKGLHKRFKSSSIFTSMMFALEGLMYVAQTERNFQIHLMLSVVALTLSAVLGLSTVEWAVVWGFIALVFFAELMNTGIELIVDLITEGKYHPTAKIIKDVAAGAVLMVAISALAAGVCLFLPPLMHLIA